MLVWNTDSGEYCLGLDPGSDFYEMRDLWQVYLLSLPVSCVTNCPRCGSLKQQAFIAHNLQRSGIQESLSRLVLIQGLSWDGTNVKRQENSLWVLPVGFHTSLYGSLQKAIHRRESLCPRQKPQCFYNIILKRTARHICNKLFLRNKSLKGRGIKVHLFKGIIKEFVNVPLYYHRKLLNFLAFLHL